MSSSRTLQKTLTGLVIALSIAGGLFQQVQTAEAKGQPARVLLAWSDIPPGFYEYPATIGQVGKCKSYTRSFENLKRNRILHSVTFCADVNENLKAMQMLRETTRMNAPTMGSLEYMWTDQKPAHADELFAICYTYKEDGRKACETTTRYGRLISTVTVDFGVTQSGLTRETLWNWTFRRNDRLLPGPSDADWAMFLGKVWRP